MLFEGFTHARFTHGDIEIAYSIAGDGPPVLLLHGFPQCRAMWARVAPLLAQRYTVVCADLRGYGDSSKPPCAPDHANYAFRAMADDQCALMQHLGLTRFHLIGHDRGGRTAHRLALDHPEAVLSVAVMDIVPTYVMFHALNRHVAKAYWHWFFLAQPAPFPERTIAANPDQFYEVCLSGWGASGLADYDPEQLAVYREKWRDPAMIHGSCSDYRAASTIDLVHDEADEGRAVQCPALVLYGGDGLMAKHFDLPATWRPRLANMRAQAVPGGHFFVDQRPNDTAHALLAHLEAAAR